MLCDREPLRTNGVYLLAGFSRQLCALIALVLDAVSAFFPCDLSSCVPRGCRLLSPFFCTSLGRGPAAVSCETVLPSQTLPHLPSSCTLSPSCLPLVPLLSSLLSPLVLDGLDGWFCFPVVTSCRSHSHSFMESELYLTLLKEPAAALLRCGALCFVVFPTAV